MTRKFLITMALVVMTVTLMAPTAQATTGWIRYHGGYVRWTLRMDRPSDDARSFSVFTTQKQTAIHQAISSHQKYLQELRALRRQIAEAKLSVAAAKTVIPSQTSSYHGSYSANWDAIAQCESRGDWSANTGNGYWGGLQFSPTTWFAEGGGPFDGQGPFPYSSGQQIAVAEKVLAVQGPGAWPNCFVS